MARYKVGNGPLCHTCVPVSLCFAGADFSKNIVNILWFSCFTCVLNATSGIGFFGYMLAVSFDVTIYGIKCTFLPVVLYVLWVLFRCCMFFAQYALCLLNVPWCPRNATVPYVLFVPAIFVVVVNLKFLLDGPCASGALCAFGQPQSFIKLHICMICASYVICASCVVCASCAICGSCVICASCGYLYNMCHLC